jgi:hypothetical protein
MSISGRVPTQSLFKDVSAAVLSTLSADWSPFNNVVKAVWTSAGRTDMASLFVFQWGSGPEACRWLRFALW